MDRALRRLPSEFCGPGVLGGLPIRAYQSTLEVVVVRPGAGVLVPSTLSFRSRSAACLLYVGYATVLSPIAQQNQVILWFTYETLRRT